MKETNIFNKRCTYITLFVMSLILFFINYFSHIYDLNLPGLGVVINFLIKSDEALFFYFIFVPLSTSLYTNLSIKNWKWSIIISAFLVFINLMRSNQGTDYFLIGPYPFVLYIYVTTFIIQNIQIIRNKILKK